MTIWTALAIACAVALAGCGDGSADRTPNGPLAEALADVAGNGSLGIGWTEPRLVDKGEGGRELIADALGPNAGSVIETAPRLRRRFGFDPLSAERLVSVGGSYAFGLRLDGVDGRRLGRALTQRDGRMQRTQQLELADVGGYAEVPNPLLRAGVLGLGARDAFGRTLTVLAISDTARASLLGRGDRMLEQPIYRAAADCLGDVVAARMIPDGLLPIAVRSGHRVLSTELGFDLAAIGVRADEREVLCVVGGTAERAGDIATALRASLAPDAREPLTGDLMGDLVRGADVVNHPYEGVEAVRAVLTPAGRQPPSVLFGAVARGSLGELISPR